MSGIGSAAPTRQNVSIDKNGDVILNSEDVIASSVISTHGKGKANNDWRFDGDPLKAVAIANRTIDINPTSQNITVKVTPSTAIMRYVVNPENPTIAQSQLDGPAAATNDSVPVAYRTVTGGESVLTFGGDVSELVIQTESGIITEILFEVN